MNLPKTIDDEFVTPDMILHRIDVTRGQVHSGRVIWVNRHGACMMEGAALFADPHYPEGITKAGDNVWCAAYCYAKLSNAYKAVEEQESKRKDSHD